MTMDFSSSYTQIYLYMHGIHNIHIAVEICTIHKEVDEIKVKFSGLLTTLLTRFSDRQESLVMREKVLCVRLCM